MSVEVGNRLGPYTIQRIIATAPTTLITLATHKDEPDQPCVLKTLRGPSIHDPEQFEYLQRELEVGGKPNKYLIHVYSVSAEPQPYAAMEFFDAPNLKQWIQNGTEAIDYYATRIVRDAALGIAEVHSRGWVHRDIKPDNFLVTNRGKVKLIDFALAQPKPGMLTKLFGSTAKGKVQGTRSYMSPEQIMSKGAVDQRADIYSFGCTIYELLGGRPPFQADGGDEVLLKHLQTPAPLLTQLCSNITSEFAELIAATLQKDPKRRPANMLQFAADLAKIQIFKKTPPKPPSSA